MGPSYKSPVLSVLLIAIYLLALAGCETATKATEVDLSQEDRVFGKIQYGKKVEFKRAIIIDVRSRFDHEMSRPPRSFNAFWKDWDLKNLTGNALEKKREDLQRLLALKGIEPLTQVVILGKGLNGQGEEFLVASTLFSLGITRVSFLNDEQAKKALLTKNLPPIENAPQWSKPLQFNINCSEPEKKSKPHIVISHKFKGKQASGFLPGQIFAKDLSVKKQRFPKSLNMQVTSPNSFWAHGLALYFKEQGRVACVQ